MQARGADARGVAVIDDQTPEVPSTPWGRRGCAVFASISRPPASRTPPWRATPPDGVARMQRRQWHVQLNTNLAIIGALKELVAAAPVPVVFDHFGGAKAALGSQQPGFADLVELVGQAQRT